MAEADVLSRIAAHTAKRVERWKKERSALELKVTGHYRRTPSDFAKAFAGPGLHVIAEVKFASPSEGRLRPEEPSSLAAQRISRSYLNSGAAALSILTERSFFGGAPEFLSAVRDLQPEAFLLMKDFFIDPYQFELARACGADCVLIIAALAGAKLEAMLDRARDLGLSALVEVHDEEEHAAALAAGAGLIGVNSRNLRTLKTDLEVARRLSPRLRPGTYVAESGLRSRAELDELAALGYKGFLIGTSLMRAQDPGAALKEFLG